MTKKQPTSPTATLKQTLEVVRDVLDHAGIGAERLQEGDGFRVKMRDENLATVGYAHVSHEARVFMFRLIFPRKVPPKQRDDVSEFCTRANYGMFVGNFELSLDTGEVRFKTYVDYRSTKLQPVYVRNAILSAMEMIEGYASALHAVLDGKASVSEAIRSVEE